ncbi:MAG TPA: alpha/beta fold hydrolase [Chloroflexia bacterium]|nr:alpha/beta fold hydrolase [Chloroflexia bacterium]
MGTPAKLGVLLLHGYTSSLDTVNGLLPTLARLDLPYRMPVLRGHGTAPRDLRGVTWPDWYADATAALDALLSEVERAAVVGLSMGGLVATQLGIERAAQLAGVALVAPAFGFTSPLAPFSGLLSKVLHYTPAPRAIYDDAAYQRNTNYTQVEGGSFASLYAYSQLIGRRVPEFQLPLLVVASRRDQIIPPKVTAATLERFGTPPAARQIHWLERSGHEILMDMERDTAFGIIGDWLATLRDA